MMMKKRKKQEKKETKKGNLGTRGLTPFLCLSDNPPCAPGIALSIY